MSPRAALLDAGRAVDKILHEIGLSSHDALVEFPTDRLSLSQDAIWVWVSSLDSVSGLLAPHISDHEMHHQVLQLLTFISNMKSFLLRHIDDGFRRVSPEIRGERGPLRPSPTPSQPTSSSSALLAQLQPRKRHSPPNTRPLLPSSLAKKREIDAVWAGLVRESRARGGVLGIPGDVVGDDGGLAVENHPSDDVQAPGEGRRVDSSRTALLSRPGGAREEEDKEEMTDLQHDAVMEEMTDMAGQLRDLSQRVLEQLQTDNTRLDSTGDLMQANLDTTITTNAKLKAESKAWSFCSSIFLILMGGLIFFAAYSGIKFIPYRPWEHPKHVEAGGTGGGTADVVIPPPVVIPSPVLDTIDTPLSDEGDMVYDSHTVFHHEHL